MKDIRITLQTLSINQKPVFLLKTPSLPSDAYEETLSQANSISLEPIFVPVLEHLFRDDALRAIKRHAERFAFAGGSPATARQKATNNPAKRYGGIIFTSQRAVDAFGSVIAKLDTHRLKSLFDSRMPLYVVGPATARGVKALNLPCPVLGEETGNGETLSRFILSHHNSLSTDVTHLEGQKLPLLFLVGEQRRDIIPNELRSSGLSETDKMNVQEVVVYETGEMATFEEDFTSLMNMVHANNPSELFIVIFSPQGCEATLNALGWLNEKTGKYDFGKRSLAQGNTRSFVLTIGPTTCEYLRTNFDFEPDAVASQPSPAGVLEAITKLATTQ